MSNCFRRSVSVSVIGLVVILGWCFLRKKQGLVNVGKSWEPKPAKGSKARLL